MTTSISSPLAFGGCPTFFRALCREGSRGGSASYFGAGHELMRHTERLVPYGAEEDEWETELETLALLVEQEDDEAILAWFVDHYPKCMHLVPKRRRESFLKGVYAMAE